MMSTAVALHATESAPDPAEPGWTQDAAGDGRSRAYNIAAVDRALDLLEALARIGPASLAAVAEEAGCTRTAGFRLLRTLQARGFAIQDRARGLWRLGARWEMLSRAADVQGALAATAQPILAALAETTAENAYFIIRVGLEGEVVALHRADPNLRLYLEPSRGFAPHAGPGRLLLAYAPQSVQAQVLSRKLARFTPATRIEPAWIAADMQRIRARDWLITSEEMFPGSVSVSAPVRDGSGEVVGAVMVASPSLRMRPPRPRSLVPQVQQAAIDLSAALGAPGAAGVRPRALPRQPRRMPAPATASPSESASAAASD